MPDIQEKIAEGSMLRRNTPMCSPRAASARHMMISLQMPLRRHLVIISMCARMRHIIQKRYEETGVELTCSPAWHAFQTVPNWLPICFRCGISRSITVRDGRCAIHRSSNAGRHRATPGNRAGDQDRARAGRGLREAIWPAGQTLQKSMRRSLLDLIPGMAARQIAV